MKTTRHLFFLSFLAILFSSLLLAGEAMALPWVGYGGAFDFTLGSSKKGGTDHQLTLSNLAITQIDYFGGGSATTPAQDPVVGMNITIGALTSPYAGGANPFQNITPSGSGSFTIGNGTIDYLLGTVSTPVTFVDFFGSPRAMIDITIDSINNSIGSTYLGQLITGAATNLTFDVLLGFSSSPSDFSASGNGSATGTLKTDITVIPEPSSLLLLGSGIGAVILGLRTKRNE